MINEFFFHLLINLCGYPSLNNFLNFGVPSFAHVVVQGLVNPRVQLIAFLLDVLCLGMQLLLKVPLNFLQLWPVSNVESEIRVVQTSS